MQTHELTIYKNAGLMKDIGDVAMNALWDDKKGPFENSLELAHNGLFFVPNPVVQAGALVTSILGMSLGSIGKVLDEALGTKTIEDAAKIDSADEAIQRLLPGSYDVFEDLTEGTVDRGVINEDIFEDVIEKGSSAYFNFTKTAVKIPKVRRKRKPGAAKTDPSTKLSKEKVSTLKKDLQRLFPDWSRNIHLISKLTGFGLLLGGLKLILSAALWVLKLMWKHKLITATAVGYTAYKIYQGKEDSSFFGSNAVSEVGEDFLNQARRGFQSKPASRQEFFEDKINNIIAGQ